MLELTQNGFRRYSKQSHEEKRQLLNSVISNSIWANGWLHQIYKQPFDILAKSNEKYAMGVKGNSEENAIFEKWPGVLDEFRTSPNLQLLILRRADKMKTLNIKLLNE